MSKIICAVYIPKQIYFSIPEDWNLEDVTVYHGTLMYKDSEVDMKRAYTQVDDEKYPQDILLCDAPVQGICSKKQLSILRAHFSGEINLNCWREDEDEDEDEEREAEEREEEEREAMQKEDKFDTLLSIARKIPLL